MDAAVDKAEERYISELRSFLRENKVRYKTITRNKPSGLLIRFKDDNERNNGQSLIEKNLLDLNVIAPDANETEFSLIITIKDEVLLETQRLALQQNITTLRKRVNELGVAEPVIQRQGLKRVVVQLPGVQDTARAKAILGATATLEFRLVDEGHEPQEAVNGRIPAGSKLYYERYGQPILL